MKISIKLFLLSLFTPLFIGLSFANDDPHYEVLYNECEENLSSITNSYTACTNELGITYETLSWLEYLTYSLYWTDWDNTYSLPLTNDIYLPYWYKAYTDSGVVAITNIGSLDYAYSIEDSDFQHSIIWSYSVVYLFVISSGLFLIFLYIIRRYFIWLKSVK